MPICVADVSCDGYKTRYSLACTAVDIFYFEASQHKLFIFLFSRHNFYTVTIKLVEEHATRMKCIAIYRVSDVSVHSFVSVFRDACDIIQFEMSSDRHQFAAAHRNIYRIYCGRMSYAVSG